MKDFFSLLFLCLAFSVVFTAVIHLGVELKLWLNGRHRK